MGFVYLLMSTDSDGEKELYKIGKTKGSIEKRIKALSTGNPNKIVLIHSYESVNYGTIEKWLHTKYSQLRTISKNEWFELTNEQVGKFMETCEEIEGNIKYLKKENHFFK
jgi:hypothetical protein